MRTFRRLVASLGAVPLLFVLTPPLAAQRVEVFGGVGGAIEVEDDFLPYAQGMLGARVGIGPVFGIRGASWINWLESNDQEVGIDLDATTFFSGNERAAVRPYALAGGSMIFRGEDPDVALNAGGGVRFRVSGHAGLFVEPRFYLVLERYATPSFAVLTVGLAYRF